MINYDDQRVQDTLLFWYVEEGVPGGCHQMQLARLDTTCYAAGIGEQDRYL